MNSNTVLLKLILSFSPQASSSTYSYMSVQLVISRRIHVLFCSLKAYSTQDQVVIKKKSRDWKAFWAKKIYFLKLRKHKIENVSENLEINW